MFDERFARQYRYEPPSEFPMNSLYTGIVHHLSGSTICALLEHLSCDQSAAGVHMPAFTFIVQAGVGI